MAKEKEYFILKKSQIRQTKSSKRVLVKADTNQKKNDLIKRGLIVASFGKDIIVENLEDKTFYECQIKGTLISNSKNSSLAVVGDFVGFIPKNDTGQSGLYLGKLESIEERTNKLSRNKVGKTDVEQVIAANVDCIVIFFAAIDPDYNRRLIDRFLVTAEQNEIQPIIVINKIDLIEIDSIWEDFEVYRDLGIEVFFISSYTREGIDALKDRISNITSVITGPSGVGKSTFVNEILGEETQIVNEISQRTNKGQHTTSYTRMFDILEGGKIIDSPGLREFGIWELDKNELSLYFHDFDNARLECKFSSCTHTHEPNCGVKDAYDAEEIDIQRFESYLNLFNSI